MIKIAQTWRRADNVRVGVIAILAITKLTAGWTAISKTGGVAFDAGRVLWVAYIGLGRLRQCNMHANDGKRNREQHHHTTMLHHLHMSSVEKDFSSIRLNHTAGDRKLQIKIIGRKAPTTHAVSRQKWLGEKRIDIIAGRKMATPHTLSFHCMPVRPTDLSQQYDIIKRCIIEKESRHQRRFHHRI